MSIILQAAISGLLMGGVYAIIAVGLSLIFGVMRIVNFAHGAFVMVAMYCSYWLIFYTGVDPYIAVIFCGLVLFAFGFLFQKFMLNNLLERANEREPISILLFTAGLGMVLENVALTAFGANPKVLNTKYSDSTINIGSIIISTPRLYAFIIAGICTGLLYWFLYKTEAGRAVRATSQNRSVAKLMGINEKLVYCVVFGVGLAFVGVAGGLLVPFYSVFPTVGSVFGLRSFVIVVLGGMGSIPGALLGGLLVGLIEGLGGQILSSSYANLIVFVIFILILLFKPSGLLGTQSE